MKLERLRVENFKSIDDSTEFKVDQLTCLMGKNEAGKTALLEALYKLNPVEAEKAKFDELDYPRRYVSTYRERAGKEPANVLTATWSLDDRDQADLAELLGATGVVSPTVVCRKGYDNALSWQSDINEPDLLDAVVKDTSLPAEEVSLLGAPRTVSDLFAALEGLESPSADATALLQSIQKSFPSRSPHAEVAKRLTSLLPKFIYFDTYHKLPGRVALTALKQLIAEGRATFGDKIFLALLDLTSSSLEEVEKIGESEKLIMELEAIQNRLTDEIFTFWSQNRHLDVKFRFDAAQSKDPPPFNQGWVFSTRIENKRHRASVNFDERSTGFIWFFSFLIWFSQLQRTYGDKLFILLDEPGLSLHGKAQKDLLRYFNERLRPTYQLIYTAHSPFMIDVEHIFDLRTVEDLVITDIAAQPPKEEILGTKVGDRILSRDVDTLFPLQGVVGYDIAQTLFVGPYVVVVEGPSEATYFHWFSRTLNAAGRTPLDLRWAICPAEGANKVTSFVTLFHGRSLKIAVLLDYHEGQKAMVDALDQSGLLDPGHLLRTSDFTPAAEADIEDVLGREMYVALVNQSLALSSPHALPTSRPPAAPERVVKEVEQHCRMLPPGFPEFDHYTPARYLIGLTEAEYSALLGLSEALSRFEAIFTRLNSLIL